MKKKNSPSSSEKISNIEAAIMGLLSEGARYGYELEKIIEQRHMRYWTEIGFSSIYYVLKRLEAKKLIRSEHKAGADGKPPRKVYTLTPEGKTEFKEKIMSLLSSHERVISPFDLGITFCAMLDKNELTECFKKRLEFLGKRLEWVSDLVEQGKSGKRPLGVYAKFSRHAAVIKSEEIWIKEFVRTLNKNSSPS